MAERSARWVDGLVPHVAVRQWVLTVPWARRWQLARHPELVKGVAAVLLEEVAGFYREGTRQAEGRTGSITVVQRFGSALNLNVHLHCLVLDGCFAEEADTGVLRFHRARAPETSDVEALVVRVVERCEAWLAEQGFGPEPEGEEEADLDDAQQVLQAASVQGRLASTGRRARREQTLSGRPFQLPPRCAGCDGYNLHGGVGLRPGDRPALERLCRYVLRPPLARARLAERPDGSVVLTLKRPWSNGTTALVFTPAELVERLASIVPPPRANTVLYHGVLSARSAWRSRVLPAPPEPAPDEPPCHPLVPVPRPTPSRWVPWARLLWRVFRVAGWACPVCRQPMRLRAIVQPPATSRVLTGLHRAARDPPAPTRAP
jgi:hypothetical protein